MDSTASHTGRSGDVSESTPINSTPKNSVEPKLAAPGSLVEVTRMDEGASSSAQADVLGHSMRPTCDGEGFLFVLNEDLAAGFSAEPTKASQVPSGAIVTHVTTCAEVDSLEHVMDPINNVPICDVDGSRDTITGPSTEPTTTSPGPLLPVIQEDPVSTSTEQVQVTTPDMPSIANNGIPLVGANNDSTLAHLPNEPHHFDGEVYNTMASPNTTIPAANLSEVSLPSAGPPVHVSNIVNVPSPRTQAGAYANLKRVTDNDDHHSPVHKIDLAAARNSPDYLALGPQVLRSEWKGASAQASSTEQVETAKQLMLPIDNDSSPPGDLNNLAPVDFSDPPYCLNRKVPYAMDVPNTTFATMPAREASQQEDFIDHVAQSYMMPGTGHFPHLQQSAFSASSSVVSIGLNSELMRSQKAPSLAALDALSRKYPKVPLYSHMPDLPYRVPMARDDEDDVGLVASGAQFYLPTAMDIMTPQERSKVKVQNELQVEEYINKRLAKKRELLDEVTHHARKDALRLKQHSSTLWGFSMDTLNLIKNPRPTEQAKEFKRELLNIMVEAHRLDLIDKDTPQI